MDNAHPGRVTWETNTEKKFNEILDVIPDMIRGIAETRVSKKAESLVRDAGRGVILEKDMVDAFFAETPGAFASAMKSRMQEVGIDFTKYGHS